MCESQKAVMLMADTENEYTGWGPSVAQEKTNMQGESKAIRRANEEKESTFE